MVVVVVHCIAICSDVFYEWFFTMKLNKNMEKIIRGAVLRDILSWRCRRFGLPDSVSLHPGYGSKKIVRGVLFFVG
jgi:hypothetical protein